MFALVLGMGIIRIHKIAAANQRRNFSPEIEPKHCTGRKYFVKGEN